MRAARRRVGGDSGCQQCRERRELVRLGEPTGSIKVSKEEDAVDLVHGPGRIADAEAVEIGHEAPGNSLYRT
jgi:hypothetical protein